MVTGRYSINRPKTVSPEHARVERYQERYADDPLKHRLLMRLYGARPTQTLQELAESLRVHPADARKSLRMLVLDGLVNERRGGRGAAYSLSSTPSARWLVTELLRRTIASGGTP
jgi:DNA-binding MarR family transcriptional regulator